jgi:hypothetical protein
VKPKNHPWALPPQLVPPPPEHGRYALEGVNVHRDGDRVTFRVGWWHLVKLAYGLYAFGSILALLLSFPLRKINPALVPILGWIFVVVIPLLFALMMFFAARQPATLDRTARQVLHKGKPVAEFDRISRVIVKRNGKAHQVRLLLEDGTEQAVMPTEAIFTKSQPARRFADEVAAFIGVPVEDA